MLILNYHFNRHYIITHEYSSLLTLRLGTKNSLKLKCYLTLSSIVNNVYIYIIYYRDGPRGCQHNYIISVQILWTVSRKLRIMRGPMTADCALVILHAPKNRHSICTGCRFSRPIQAWKLIFRKTARLSSTLFVSAKARLSRYRSSRHYYNIT